MFVRNSIVSVLAALVMLVGLPVQAQTIDLETTAPQEPSSGAVSDIETPVLPAEAGVSDEIIVDAITAIHVSEGIQSVENRAGDVSAAVTEHLPGLGKRGRRAVRKYLSAYLQQPLSLALLEEISNGLLAVLQDHNRPVADVIIPAGQDISSGQVEFQVLFGNLAAVTVEPGRYFDNRAHLINQLRQKQGEALDGKRLQGDVAWLNENPFRQVDAVLSRGANPGETDLKLKVKDQRPSRFYLGAANNGTELSGENRGFAGFNLGNLWWRGHRLNYQYTLAEESERLRSHSLSYIAPFSWQHRLRLYGATQESDPPVTVDGFDLTAENDQAGVRYEIPLLPRGSLHQEVSLGYDFKRSNNNLQFGGADVNSTFTEISQWALDYKAQWRGQRNTTAFGLNYNYSPGDQGDANTDEAFNAARSGATSDYQYARLNFSNHTRIGKRMGLNMSLGLQFSNRNLLPSEQLGLGAGNLIRGYDEYALTGDEGVVFKLEFHTPHFRIAGNPQHTLGLLWFADYGRISNVDRLEDEPESTEIYSSGIGLRYRLTEHFSLNLDYGWQLEELGDEEKDGQLHGSLFLSF